MGDAEVDLTPDDNLPAYDAEQNDTYSKLSPGQILQVGPLWAELHRAWGEHPANHPLGFLCGGGVRLPAFEGELSSGRYFSPRDVAWILEALANASKVITPGVVHRVFKRARTAEPVVQEAYERIHQFLSDVCAAGRGIIVHLFE